MTEKTFIASASGTFQSDTGAFACTLGRGSVIAAEDKREGDGASPIGKWRMKRVFYRPDRVERPKSNLPIVPLRETDGWCDAADHPLYNRPVALPFAASHERLWREDHAYDVIVELSHNDDPVVPGLGSAIFVHVAHDDGRATEGCVALSLTDLLAVLQSATPKTFIEISA